MPPRALWDISPTSRVVGYFMTPASLALVYHEFLNASAKTGLFMLKM